MSVNPKITIVGYCIPDLKQWLPLQSDTLLTLTIHAQQVQLNIEPPPQALRLYTCLFAGPEYEKARRLLKPNRRVKLYGSYVLFKKQEQGGWINRPTVWVEQFRV